MGNTASADFVVLFGPPAVGKTTVGTKLATLTGFKLYHSHLTMDVLTEFFEFGSPAFMRLHRLFVLQILEEAAALGQSMILTSGWRFDQPTETAFNVAVGEPFLSRGGRVHYVELWAPLPVRLERNRTPQRQASKKTDWATDEYLREQDSVEDRNSKGSLPLGIDFLRLETESLSADEAANRIRVYIQRPLGSSQPRQ